MNLLCVVLAFLGAGMGTVMSRYIELIFGSFIISRLFKNVDYYRYPQLIRSVIFLISILLFRWLIRKIGIMRCLTMAFAMLAVSNILIIVFQGSASFSRYSVILWISFLLNTISLVICGMIPLSIVIYQQISRYRGAVLGLCALMVLIPEIIYLYYQSLDSKHSISFSLPLAAGICAVIALIMCLTVIRKHLVVKMDAASDANTFREAGLNNTKMLAVCMASMILGMIWIAVRAGAFYTFLNVYGHYTALWRAQGNILLSTLMVAFGVALGGGYYMVCCQIALEY